MFTTYRELGKQGEYDRYWLENLNDSGSFSEPINSVYLSSFSVLGDLDNDADLDIVFSDAQGTIIDWVENYNGLGDYLGRPLITDQVIGLRSIVLADIDGDDYPDIISASVNDNKIAWYPNRILNTDTFENLKTKVLPTPAIQEISIVGLFDIDSTIIYNVIGEVVMECRQKATLNISALKAGVYFLHLTTIDGSTEVHQFIKK